MLGVFLLLAFTSLEHECQHLLSQWNACMHRLDLSLYSHLKECFCVNINLFLLAASHWKRFLSEGSSGIEDSEDRVNMKQIHHGETCLVT